jgi:hypothetical protein
MVGCANGFTEHMFMGNLMMVKMSLDRESQDTAKYEGRFTPAKNFALDL